MSSSSCRLLIGILIGRFATCPDNESSEKESQEAAAHKETEDNEIRKIINDIKSENIRTNLR